MTLEIKAVIVALILCVIVYAGYRIEKHGYDRCDVIYQAHLASDKAATDSATKLSEETNAIVQKQHQIDVRAVKSKAGQSAIADYISSHGMLPCGIQVQSASAVQAIGEHGHDATAGELGTGSVIARFTEACAIDALSVLRWQEWATLNRLPVQ